MNVDTEGQILISIFGIVTITILLAVINIQSKGSYQKKKKKRLMTCQDNSSAFMKLSAFHII